MEDIEITGTITQNGNSNVSGQIQMNTSHSGEIEIRNNGTYIQWKYADDTVWKNIVAISELKGATGAQGPAGPTGATGETGPQGPAGQNGTNGTNGIDGEDGEDGADGKSAYQIWLDNGHVGTEAEFLASLVGPQGPAGTPGLTNHNFTFSTLSDNTTSITFAANQRCYQRETMTAGATLTFAINNASDNYLRIYNSSASAITLAIGSITYNGTAISTIIVPNDTISVAASAYVEIGIVCDATEADITVSQKLKLNS